MTRRNAAAAAGLLLEPVDHGAKAEDTFVLPSAGPKIVEGAEAGV